MTLHPTRHAQRVRVSPTVEIACLIDDYTDGWKDAPVVMLIHGIAESAEAFNGWVPHLARQFRVIRPDLRGYGESTFVGQHEELRLDEMAHDIDALVRELGLERVHVVGAKLGAQIALLLAQEQPDWLASMTLAGVLISPGGAVGKWIDTWIGLVDEQGVEAWARHTQPGRMGKSLSPEAMEWWTHYMGKAPPSAVKACFRMLPGLAEPAHLEQITCPTQVIVAVLPDDKPDATNQRQPVADVARWQSRIPNSRLVELEADSYHIAATHPDACAEIARKFILELATQGALMGR